MTGRVENRHALLPVMLRRPSHGDVEIEFVIDTGFTEALCLPIDAVAALGLPYQFDFPASLADGSQVLLPVHEATILWEGRERRVHALATGTRPLLGAALLDQMELVIRFAEYDLVTVEAL